MVEMMLDLCFFFYYNILLYQYFDILFMLNYLKLKFLIFMSINYLKMFWILKLYLYI